MGEASTQVLHTIGEDTEENREIQVNTYPPPSTKQPKNHYENVFDPDCLSCKDKLGKKAKNSSFYRKMNYCYENFYSSFFKVDDPTDKRAIKYDDTTDMNGKLMKDIVGNDLKLTDVKDKTSNVDGSSTVSFDDDENSSLKYGDGEYFRFIDDSDEILDLNVFENDYNELFKIGGKCNCSTENLSKVAQPTEIQHAIADKSKKRYEQDKDGYYDMILNKSNSKGNDIVVGTVDFGDDFEEMSFGKDGEDRKFVYKVNFGDFDPKNAKSFEEDDLYEDVDVNAWKGGDDSVVKRRNTLDVILEDGESDYYRNMDFSQESNNENKVLKDEILKGVDEGNVRFVRNKVPKIVIDDFSIENVLENCTEYLEDEKKVAPAKEKNVKTTKKNTVSTKTEKTSIFRTIRSKVKRFVNKNCDPKGQIECCCIKNNVSKSGSDVEVCGSLNIKVLNANLKDKHLVTKSEKSPGSIVGSFTKSDFVSHNGNKQSFERFVKRSESYYGQNDANKNVTEVRIFYNPTFEASQGNFKKSNASYASFPYHDMNVFNYEEYLQENWVYILCVSFFFLSLIFGYFDPHCD